MWRFIVKAPIVFEMLTGSIVFLLCFGDLDLRNRGLSYYIHMWQILHVEFHCFHQYLKYQWEMISSFTLILWPWTFDLENHRNRPKVMETVWSSVIRVAFYKWDNSYNYVRLMFWPNKYSHQNFCWWDLTYYLILNPHHFHWSEGFVAC